MRNPPIERPRIEFNINLAGNIQHEIFGDGADRMVQNIWDTWSYNNTYVDRHHFMMIPFNKSAAILLDCPRTDTFTDQQKTGAAIVPLRLHMSSDLQTMIRSKLNTAHIRQNISYITNWYFNQKRLPLAELFIKHIVIRTMDLICNQLCEEEGTRFILEVREGYQAALKNFECRLQDPQVYGLDEVFKNQVTERIQMNVHKITKHTQEMAQQQGTKDFMWSFTSPLVAIVLFCAGIGVAWWLKTKK